MRLIVIVDGEKIGPHFVSQFAGQSHETECSSHFWLCRGAPRAIHGEEHEDMATVQFHHVHRSPFDLD